MKHADPKTLRVRREKGRTYNLNQIRRDNGIKYREKREGERKKENERERRRNTYYQHFLMLYNQKNNEKGDMRQ